MGKKYFIAVLIAGLLLCFSFQATAVTITTATIDSGVHSAPSTDPWGFFTGTLTYTVTDASHATLSFAITPSDNSTTYTGYMATFLFNNPSDLITGVTLTTAPSSSWKLFGSSNYSTSGTSWQNLIDGSPYGRFDIGATVVPVGTAPTQFNRIAFNSVASYGLGVQAGTTATFTFTFTGSALDSLTASSFANALSSGVAGKDNRAFATHIAFGSGFSDKVATPLPASVLLMGSGLLGLGLIGWRRRERS